MAKHSQDESVIVYTESDGNTKWEDLIKEIGQADRKPRGLLLVVDEAFRNLNDTQRTDIHNSYYSVYNTWRSVGVRAVLIGQQIGDICGVLGRYGLGADVLEKSTLIIGGQKEDDNLRRAIVAQCDEQDIANLEWLDCGDPEKINDIASRKPLPYKVGPVIVRPSLFANTICHPIPCHVSPELLSDTDRMACETKWWSPGT